MEEQGTAKTNNTTDRQHSTRGVWRYQVMVKRESAKEQITIYKTYT